MNTSEKIRTLIKYIGDKTDREIDKIEEETATRVKETEEEFKNRAEREYRETIENAKRYADSLLKRLVSQARTEARKIDLEAKALFLESTIQQIKEEAKKLIDSPEYADILKTLIKESIATLDEREIVIKASKADREIIPKILKEIKKELGEETKITVAKETLEERAIIIAESGNGRVSVKNSIPGKIEEHREEIATLLFEKLEKAINA